MANELTIDILVAVAADEARKISERTKAGAPSLQGPWRCSGHCPDSVPQSERSGSPAGSDGSGQGRRRAADEAYSDIVSMMRELRSQGLSQQAIADRLNAEGHTTRRGASWNQVQVARVLQRGVVMS